jgi:hypothetical protein
MAPEITSGAWKIESDGVDEFDIVSEEGKIITSIDGAFCDSDDEMHANVQCLHLVPELVRAVYTSMRALRGAMPDDETPESISQYLSELLRQCYASPELRRTISP